MSDANKMSKEPPLTDSERLAVFRLSFAERSLISMRCQLAENPAVRRAIVRAALIPR